MRSSPSLRHCKRKGNEGDEKSIYVGCGICRRCGRRGGGRAGARPSQCDYVRGVRRGWRRQGRRPGRNRCGARGGEREGPARARGRRQDVLHRRRRRRGRRQDGRRLRHGEVRDRRPEPEEPPQAHLPHRVRRAAVRGQGREDARARAGEARRVAAVRLPAHRGQQQGAPLHPLRAEPEQRRRAAGGVPRLGPHNHLVM